MGRDGMGWDYIQGCYWYTNGAVYEGEYRNGRVHGKGRATFPSGDSYAGEWKDGAMSGHGVYDFKAEGARWGHLLIDAYKEMPPYNNRGHV